MIEHYADVLKFEESRLGKFLREVLAKSREDRIEALIYHAKNSTDNVVSRIAWSLDSDSVLLATIDQIKSEFESRPVTQQEEQGERLYPEYTVPMVVGGELELNP